MSYSDISTHGPARGPTWKALHPRWKRALFQLTAPRGGRQINAMSQKILKKFQLTAPRGGRPVTRAARQGSQRFQLTAPRGGRLTIPAGLYPTTDFNSRPREGADQERGWKRCAHVTFQLTAPRGGRPSFISTNGKTFTFQLTAPRGGRRIPFRIALCRYSFQLTAPRGGRR